jgi:hypothetical protein
MQLEAWRTAAAHFLDWALNIREWNSPEAWVARIVFALLFFLALCWIVTRVLEWLAKLVALCKTVGLRVSRTEKQKLEIRRRIQFARVLQSDLASLAKAENWNDQWFTDLEAEVEVEGKYFRSAWERLLNRPAKGLRRVPSLVQAIESADEQFLLVVGDPGSGKSVALRHLGHTLAKRASESRAADVLIPLYINLKELPSATASQLNADFIKEFVIDNVRRGDADTAAFIKEHWDDFRSRGIWYFLFDSFDEIPAVLHAPSGSDVIEEHAKAIRHFLQGMSACKGVIGSREFKGPKRLPWSKLRILPLNWNRQRELVENSFLSIEQKKAVFSHLVETESKLLQNPLFLTLLCRFVKDEGRTPANDHDLVIRHIERLARRDNQFLQRHYRLTSEELLKGATFLAVLFAENSKLSLAPTHDEIRAALLAVRGSCVGEQNLEPLLSALVDVKIARCDVREAREGDRRFTFSHRRFQEALFVQYLGKNPTAIPHETLLTDLRWREYAVTFLQTQFIKECEPLIDRAITILRAIASSDNGIEIKPVYGGKLRYFEWEDNEIASIISLLHEGTLNREGLASRVLQPVALILENRWQSGDAYDRMMVLEHGWLLENSALSDKIQWAIENGPDMLRNSAFRAGRFLRDCTEDVASWIRKQIAIKVLHAQEKSDLERVRAWVNRLPDSIGARFVLQRCEMLRQALGWLVSERLFNRLEERLADRSAQSKRRQRFLNVFFPFVCMYGILPFMFLFNWAGKSQSIDVGALRYALQGIAIGASAGLAILAAKFAFKDAGERVTRDYLIRKVRLFKFGRAIRQLTPFVLVAAIVASLPGLLVHLIYYLFTGKHFQLKGYPYAAAFAYTMLISYFYIQTSLFARKAERRLRTVSEEGELPSPLLATSQDELFVWFTRDKKILKKDRTELRSLLRLLSTTRREVPEAVSQAPLFQGRWSWRVNSPVLELVLKKIADRGVLHGKKSR